MEAMMDRIEIFNMSLFLLIMGLVIWGIMGREGWIWQVILWAINTFGG
jgi:hypothetical protein